MRNFIFVAEPTTKINEIHLPEKWYYEHSKTNKRLQVKLWRKNGNNQPLILSPILWERDFVGLNPLITAGMAADFDGDNLFELEIMD